VRVATRILDQLAGPDRRSIGRSPLVVRRILRAPTLLPSLIRGLTAPDPLVRMRAADALEKVARRRPELFGRYRARLLQIARDMDQAEVQWHMAQLFGRLELTPAQRIRARRVLRRYLRSASAIVQTMALDALIRLAPATAKGQKEASRLLQGAAVSAFPAVRARARRLRASRRSIGL
jgi:HEAT repeat protein